MAHPLLISDCPATAIPAGTPAVLPKGTEVAVMQTLGGNVTVRAAGGLYRIDRDHAGAIPGFTPEEEAPAQARGSDDSFREEDVWAALRTCFDPEIPVNIVDLGLVYDLAVERTEAGSHRVAVKMTLTAPGCGMGDVLVQDVREKIAAIPTVRTVTVELTFDPPWSQSMMSEAARLQTGMMW